MKLERPLVFLDVETTGIDPMQDRIIEIGFASLTTSGRVVNQRWLIDPQRPIPPEATTVHGITNDHLVGAATFAIVARSVLMSLEDSDLAGYNLRRLDLPIIDQELRRCGLMLDLTGVRIIDCYGIFAKKYPKTLADAVRVFAGREHTGAHGALEDALATLDVFKGQLSMHPDLAAMTLDELARFSAHSDKDYADLAGKLYRDADGDLRYSFGKPKDVKVRDDTGYAHWMLTKASFPANTCEVLEAELDRLDREAIGEPLEESDLF